MMDHNSQKTDKSQEMRSSLFNTINLINDLESGNPSSPSGSNRAQKKDISLSDTFVSGIKEKQIDYSRSGKSTVSQSGVDVDKFTSAMQAIEKEINGMKQIIASNDDEISSLKMTISGLKAKLESSQANIQDASRQTQDTLFSSYEQDSGADSSSPVDDSIFTDVPSDDSPQNKDDDKGYYDDQGSSESIFNPLKEDDGNFGVSPEQRILGGSDSSPQSSDSMSPEQSEPLLSQQSVAPKEAEASDQGNSPSSDPNPRVGNYESSDVLIEKYFYYGKK